MGISMKLSKFTQGSTEEIQQLFTKTFTDSEGRSEGLLIGKLAADLIDCDDSDNIQCFTASEAGKIIASIFFSRLTFEESEINAFLLAPVAVHTDHQGQGIGQKLINYGISSLRDEGVALVFTYGDIHFYSKVGFWMIDENIVKAPLPLSYPDGWLGQSLTGSVLKPISGNSHCVNAINKPEYW
jgi:putative acetyltransferase